MSGISDVAGVFNDVELPSNGQIVGYPKSVKINWFKVIDVKKLASVSKEGFHSTLVDVVQGNVLPGSVDVLAMTLQDFDFLVAKIRINSVGKFYEFGVRCNHCQTLYPLTVDLTKLQVVSIKEDFKEPLRIKVPGGNKEKVIELRMPRVKDYIDIKKLPESDQEHATYASALGKNYEEGLKILDQLTPIQEAYVAKFLELYDYGLVFEWKSVCTSCKKEIEHGIPFRESSFFRFEEVSEVDFRNAICVDVPR